MRKLSLLVAAGVGYVLGAKAGRERYDQIVTQTKKLLGSQPVATGKYSVLFSPDTGFSLLLYLATALNGDHLSRGRSWLADKMQAPLGNERVTVHNDGRRPRGLSGLPFDGEGVDTRRTR